MNNTKLMSRFIMWVVTLALLGSCVTDDELVDEKLDEAARTEQINAVKNWYKRQTITQSTQTRSVSDLMASQYRPSYSGEPSWEYFAVNKNDTMSVVDVDLTDRIGQDYVTEENLEAYRTTKNHNFRRSYTRLVYTMNRKTNTEQGFLMTIIPSKYYAKTYSNRVRKNTYLHRDKYLAGYVLFHNLDGKFVNGWEYKRGKIIGRIRMPRSQEDAAGKRRLLLSYISAAYRVKPKLYTPAQTRYGSEYDWGYGDDIWGDPIYDGGSIPEITITPDPPTPDFEYPTDWPPTIEVPEDNSYDESGPYEEDPQVPFEPTDPPTPPVLAKIYNSKSTLNNEEQKVLENCLNELIKMPCYKLMYNALINKGIQLTFNMVNDPNKIAYFERNSNSISFSSVSNLQVVPLREEFIHAVQYNLFYPNMDNSKRNYEFEAKVLQDVGMALSGLGGALMGSFGMYDSIKYGEKYNELMEKFYEGGRWDDKSTALYQQLGEMWNQYPGIFDSSIEPKLLINYLK